VKICPTCSASYGNDLGFCPRDGSALRSSACLEPGSIIRKKYEIISEVGRGGMGVVYRARHILWNEERAIKVLAAESPVGQQGLKSLLAEAQVMRQLQHPNIVRVEDADYTEDDQLFVVMEYVEGESLRQRLRKARVLAPEFALKIAAQTCSALSAAHQKGIIHRDIKPQNLLLARTADGRQTLKVIDFGIAKVREEAGLGFTGMMTGTTGFFVGTPEYASPEQAQGVRGSELDGRTDLYSLGLVLYEMMTGGLPFAADTPVAVLVQRIQARPAPLDESRPDLHFSPDVSNLVMTALERERENRFPSAEEMQRAIGAVLASHWDERARPAEAARLVAVPAQREHLASEGAEREQRETAHEEQAVRQEDTPKIAGDQERESLVRKDVSVIQPLLGRPISAPKLVVARVLSNRITATVLILVVAYLLFAGCSFFLLHHRGMQLDHDIHAEVLTDPDAIWSRWADVSKGNAQSLALFAARRSVKKRLVAAADRVIEKYRNSETQPVHENDWKRASQYLARALEIDPNDETTRGELRLCEGQIDRIGGFSHHNAAMMNEAVQKFEEAEQALPHTPDPELGLAAVYVYGLKDADKAYAALQEAQRRGYKLGNREKSQLADGYRDRGDRLFWDSRDVRGLPQEKEQIQKAADDYRRALELYQGIIPYASANVDIVRVQASLSSIGVRLAELQRRLP